MPITKEREKYLRIVRYRFIKIHGQGKWYDFCQYAIKMNYGYRVVARILGITDRTVRYWKHKII